MGLSFFQRLNDWLTFTMSAMVTSIGVMTLSEKIALAGLLVGMVLVPVDGSIAPASNGGKSVATN